MFEPMSTLRMLASPAWLAQRLHLYAPMERARVALYGLTPGGRRWRTGAATLYGLFVRPGDLCFDVGANLGNRTDVFLALGARVVTVEPQEVCLRYLRRRYRNDTRVTLVPAALGRQVGEAEMMVSQAHPISSLSDRWVQAVSKTGQFAQFEWTGRITVPVTTLDELIAAHGVPAFCKIDVEGYEREVLAGLSRPIPVLSFEFTPDYADGAVGCIDRLAELGTVEFNYSEGESMELALSRWVGPAEIRSNLTTVGSGDIYARFPALSES
jgi:FkbM family methyltransferase